VQHAKQAWRVRLPEDQGEWLGWLIGLPQAELIELLALCGALTVNALPAAGAAGSANAIAAALGLDMAGWWVPTAEAYLNHVSKAQIIAALKEAGPELAGTRWLPEPLRRSPG
jgi:ParB family transcriptional regulator, chromosome partitioning protein